MKIQFCTPPTPTHLHGWKRIIRRLKNALHGTLVIDLSRIKRKFAN